MTDREIEYRAGKVLLIDKPLNWTSFDIVKKIKNNLPHRKIKIGHAGTLDPLASGLLILCTGKKTKEIDQYQAQEKEYIGELILGKTTPSVDLETDFDEVFPIDHITEKHIHETTELFTGEINQIPPMFSAVKIGGERLYKKARTGEVVEINPRKITIDVFEITSIDMPSIHFRVVCSKGTYIRSLVRDFGKALNSGAYLNMLRRTRIGDYDIKQADQIEDLITRLKEEN